MKKQLTYPEALEVLGVAYAQEKIQLTAKVSTLEVTVGQQTIQIKKLEERLNNAQVVLDEKIDIILRLQKEIEEAWEIVDEQVLEGKNLQMDVKELQGTVDELWGRILGNESSLTDESLILQYTGVAEDTPTDVSAIYREKYPSVFKPATEDTLFPGNATPESHPYTNPIRDIRASNKIKRSEPLK